MKESDYVRVDGKSSEMFVVDRGVRQDSDLSPSLFPLLMGPLLKQLEDPGLGLSINNFYMGASFMLTTSTPWLQA